METIEGNKLIAEFITGNTNVNDDTAWINIPFVRFKRFIPLADLKYHLSLDWLKPVIDKAWDECKFYSDGLKFFEGLTIFSTINQVWIAVINFIQWYNNQVKP